MTPTECTAAATHFTKLWLDKALKVEFQTGTRHFLKMHTHVENYCYAPVVSDLNVVHNLLSSQKLNKFIGSVRSDYRHASKVGFKVYVSFYFDICPHSEFSSLSFLCTLSPFVRFVLPFCHALLSALLPLGEFSCLMLSYCVSCIFSSLFAMRRHRAPS